MQTARSLYEILQVDPRAEPEVLEAAFRRLARKYHPDVSDTDDAAERMKELNAAYEVLGDPARRAAYDGQLVDPAAAGVAEPDPEEEGPAAQTALGCRQHPDAVAVATCGQCGAGLCEQCFVRFQPPSCLTCALAWARRPHRRLLLPTLWFFIVLGVMVYLLANSTSLVTRGSP